MDGLNDIIHPRKAQAYQNEGPSKRFSLLVQGTRK